MRGDTSDAGGPRREHGDTIATWLDRPTHPVEQRAQVPPHKVEAPEPLVCRRAERLIESAGVHSFPMNCAVAATSYEAAHQDYYGCQTMCGIAGFYLTAHEYCSTDLSAMTDTLAHRGPDADGQFLDDC